MGQTHSVHKTVGSQKHPEQHTMYVRALVDTGSDHNIHFTDVLVVRTWKLVFKPGLADGIIQLLKPHISIMDDILQGMNPGFDVQNGYVVNPATTKIQNNLGVQGVILTASRFQSPNFAFGLLFFV